MYKRQPVRIVRDGGFQAFLAEGLAGAETGEGTQCDSGSCAGARGATSGCGLYPCGEGAGYAGGIMSAAVDGLRVAEALAAASAEAL